MTIILVLHVYKYNKPQNEKYIQKDKNLNDKHATNQSVSSFRTAIYVIISVLSYM